MDLMFCLSVQSESATNSVVVHMLPHVTFPSRLLVPPTVRVVAAVLAPWFVIDLQVTAPAVLRAMLSVVPGPRHRAARATAAARHFSSYSAIDGAIAK